MAKNAATAAINVMHLLNALESSLSLPLSASLSRCSDCQEALSAVGVNKRMSVLFVRVDFMAIMFRHI